MSESFISKFIEDTFRMGNITSRGWFRTWFWGIIDSRENKRQLLDDYIKNQVKIANKEIIEKGMEFKELYANVDLRIVEICKWVNNNFTYVSDKDLYGSLEVWDSVNVIWENEKADCEGLNTLVFCLAMFAGISQWQLWNAVDYFKLGHYFLMYFSLKTDKWYAIDAAYYPDNRPINLRPQFSVNPAYRDKCNIDFLFNESGIYKRKII